MTRNKSSKSPSRRGFRKLSFDEAFPIAVEEDDIADELDGPLGELERRILEEWRREQANRITPAFRQASSPLDSLVRTEATAWIKQHGGMQNVSAFIKHLNSLPGAVRIYQCGSTRRLTADAIRKKLKKMGIG